MLGENRTEGITYGQRKRYLSFILWLSLSSKYNPGQGRFPSLCSLGAFTEHTQRQRLTSLSLKSFYHFLVSA